MLSTHQVASDHTKDGIDDDIKEYLKLGPDFSETPKKLPYEKVIIETEKMCQLIDKENESNPDQTTELEQEAHRLREDVKQLLKRRMNKEIKSNLKSSLAGRKWKEKSV